MRGCFLSPLDSRVSLVFLLSCLLPPPLLYKLVFSISLSPRHPGVEGAVVSLSAFIRARLVRPPIQPEDQGRA